MPPQDFLSTYTSYAGELTEASPDYHIFVGLATIGSVIGNKVWFPFGSRPIACNTWLILLGESSIDFKSTAFQIAVELLRKLGTQTKQRFVYPEEFSYEALVSSIAKKPDGTLFADEFSTFMATLNRKYNQGAKGLLSTLFQYRGEYERELRGKTFTIKDPAPSLWCVSNYDWFINNLEREDVSGGLIYRFLMIPSVRQGRELPLPPPPDPIKRSLLLNHLFQFSQIKGIGYMKEAAKALHDEWYRKIKIKAGKGPFAPFAVRLQSYLIKFAMLLEINATMTLKISVSSMRGAIGLIDWLYKRMEQIQSDEIVFTPGEKDVLSVKKAIRRHPDQEPTRAELSRLTHLGKWHLDRAIETLLDRKQLTVRGEKKAGKKPVTKYRLI